MLSESLRNLEDAVNNAMRTRTMTDRMFRIVAERIGQLSVEAQHLERQIVPPAARVTESHDNVVMLQIARDACVSPCDTEERT